MLPIAQQVHALSGGDFDPTVYPLSRPGALGRPLRVPSEDEQRAWS